MNSLDSIMGMIATEAIEGNMPERISGIDLIDYGFEVGSEDWYFEKGHVIQDLDGGRYVIKFELREDDRWLAFIGNEWIGYVDEMEDVKAIWKAITRTELTRC